MTAPTMASAQASAAASRAAKTEVAPASETVDGEQLRGGFIIPLIALIAIILGLCAASVICSDGDDPPTSP
jgi:hypothetical protein